MKNYVAVVRKQSDEDIEHYGVLGMRWGVIRGTKALAKATTDKQRDKAVSKLTKHREKSTNEIAKIKKQNDKLESKYDKKVVKREMSAAKLEKKSARLERKAYGRFTSEDKADKLLYKSKKLEVRAKDLRAKANEAKTKIEHNEEMVKLFKKGINDIDNALIDSGRKYLEN